MKGKGITITSDDISKMSGTEKWDICYKGYKSFSGENISLAEYVQMTMKDWYEIFSDPYVYDWCGFEEYFNELTFSFANDLVGTPFSTV